LWGGATQQSRLIEVISEEYVCKKGKVRNAKKKINGAQMRGGEDLSWKGRRRNRGQMRTGKEALKEDSDDEMKTRVKKGDLSHTKSNKKEAQPIRDLLGVWSFPSHNEEEMDV